MKKEKFFILGVASLCLSTTFMTANANEAIPEELDASYYAERLNNNNPIDLVVASETIKVRNISIQPLIEFENQDRAMTKFKEQYAIELDKIRIEFNLLEIDDNNFKEYFLIVQSMSNSDLISWDAISEILAFFDLYENKSQNQEIEMNLEMYENNPREEYLELVDELSPDYNAPLSAKGKAMMSQPMTRSMALPNIQAAIDYAIEYAVTPNYNYTYWRNGDCTNFVSQILHASGVGMDVSGTLNPNQGWWISSNAAAYAWIRADTFTRYMGRRAYYSWSSLVSSLHPGAFIATDYTGDGEVNHCAFITAKNGQYVGIAQHTSNYHDWSYNTGWPTENGKRILYNVR